MTCERCGDRLGAHEPVLLELNWIFNGELDIAPQHYRLCMPCSMWSKSQLATIIRHPDSQPNYESQEASDGSD